MGLVEEDLDGLGRLRFLGFINRWQSIARERVTEGHKEKVPGPHRAGFGGTRVFEDLKRAFSTPVRESQSPGD